MSEWSNEPASKTGVCYRTEGSNPSLSSEQNEHPLRVLILFMASRDEKPRRGFDKTRESEANKASFALLAKGQNP